ncbi:MAG TPA: hypothetical protein VEI02_03295 [Planctomycetota bacterium]|nr:hypothetical protein [Planctomycetota bacterium]
MKRLLVATCALASLVSAQLPNGVCSGATPVFAGINPSAPAGASGSFLTNVGESAGLEAGNPSVCTSAGRDVFYTFTANTSGLHVFSTCTPVGFTAGSNSDTVLQILSGTCGSLTSLACNDEACGSRSTASATLTSGTTYYVRVMTWSTGAGGTFYLSITEPVPPPANDDFANSIEVFDGVNPAAPFGSDGTRFTNLGAVEALDTNGGTIPNPTCGSGNNSDVWFHWTAGFDGQAVVQACPPLGFTSHGSHIDTVIQVLDGSATTQLGCNDDFCAPGFGGNAYLSRATFAATSGSTYYFRVMSWSGTPDGSFYLTVGADAQNAQVGTGCGAIVPTLTASGDPVLGMPGTITLNAEANAGGLMFFSPPTNVYTDLGGGCTLYLQNPGFMILTPIFTDGSGTWSLSITFPNDPAFSGLAADLQAFLVGQSGLAFSNALHLVLGY